VKKTTFFLSLQFNVDLESLKHILTGLIDMMSFLCI